MPQGASPSSDTYPSILKRDHEQDRPSGYPYTGRCFGEDSKGPDLLAWGSQKGEYEAKSLVSLRAYSVPRHEQVEGVVKQEDEDCLE